MSGRRNSWVKNYEEVDFELPLFDNGSGNSNGSGGSGGEREAMLQNAVTRKTSSGSSTPELPPLALDVAPARPRPPKQGGSLGQSSQEASSSSVPVPATHPPDVNPGSGPIDSGSHNGRSTPRTSFHKNFPSSPLNPSSPPVSSPFARPGSRTSTYINRIASEETRAFGMMTPTSLKTVGSRGSMILYRRADTLEDGTLAPPRSHLNRNSVYSTSGDSIVSLSSDSKYPIGAILASERGLVAYAYDPSIDESEPATQEDRLHDPIAKFPEGSLISWRGVLNVTSLAVLVSAAICLFIVYPVVMAYTDSGVNLLITFNTRINSTGQASPVNFDPRDAEKQAMLGLALNPIDPATPLTSYTRLTQDGTSYDLVFSDEFNDVGRSFAPGADRTWEADTSSDLYSPSQLTTQDGRLVVRLDSVPVTPRFSWGSRKGETRYLTLSGLLRNEVPFCFLRSGGFVEVGLSGKRMVYWVAGASQSPPSGWTTISASESNPMPNPPSRPRSIPPSSPFDGVGLTLTIGILATPQTSNTALPLSHLGYVEYVRVYHARQGQESELSSSRCELSTAEMVQVSLDVLDNAS